MFVYSFGFGFDFPTKQPVNGTPTCQTLTRARKRSTWETVRKTTRSDRHQKTSADSYTDNNQPNALVVSGVETQPVNFGNANRS